MNLRPDSLLRAAYFYRLPALAVLSCLWIVSPAYAQKVPEHLASMAVSLFSTSEQRFQSADPETTHGWAEHQARETIIKAGVPRWRAGKMPAWRGQDDLLRELGFDPESDDIPFDLEDFIMSAWQNGSEVAISQLFAEIGRAPLDATEMTALTGRVDAALVKGYKDMERRHVFQNATGPDLILEWAPEVGTFDMQVIEKGSELQAPFQSVLTGAFQPDLGNDVAASETAPDEETTDAPDINSDTRFLLSPLPEPLVTYDADDLKQIRGNVFGEWMQSDGTKWQIFPMNAVTDGDPKETAKENPQAIALARLNAAIAELDEMHGSKVYVWVNPETGAREEQDRFRRKKDPWAYEGEQQNGAGTPEQIAALEAEIEELGQTINGNSAVPDAPELAEPTEDNRVQAIQVSYIRSDGTVAVFDQARLSGSKITGNRVLRVPNDISGVPEAVISQLIASWQPPEWIDLDVKLTSDGQLQIAGGRWRLHVTYSGDTYDISSIHTPYAIQTTLTRDDRRKAP